MSAATLYISESPSGLTPSSSMRELLADDRYLIAEPEDVGRSTAAARRDKGQEQEPPRRHRLDCISSRSAAYHQRKTKRPHRHLCDNPFTDRSHPRSPRPRTCSRAVTRRADRSALTRRRAGQRAVRGRARARQGARVQGAGARGRGGRHQPASDAWPDLLRQQLPRLASMLETLGFHVVEAAGRAARRRVATRAPRSTPATTSIIVGIDKRYAQLVSDRVWWYDANKDARYTPEIVQKRFNVPPGAGRASGSRWSATTTSCPASTASARRARPALLEKHGSVARRARDARRARGPRSARRCAPRATRSPRARARDARSRPRAAACRSPSSRYARARPPAALNALYDELGFVELLVARRRSRSTSTVCETAADARARRSRALGTASRSRVHALARGSDAGARRARRHRARRRATATRWYVPRDSAAWPALARVARGRGRARSSATTSSARSSRCAALGIAARRHRRRLGVRVAPHASRATGRRTTCRSSRSTCSAARCPTTTRCAASASSARRGARCRVERAAGVAGQRADAVGRDLARSSRPTSTARCSPSTSSCRTLLVRMELTGIVVDPRRARSRRGGVRADRGRARARRSTRSPATRSTSTRRKQLGTVLFEELKLPIVSHTKTGWSTAIEALERIEHAHPIVPLVLRWRALRRLRDNWIIVAAPLHRRRRPRALALSPGALVLGPAGQHEPRPRPRAGPHAGDGADPPRVRRRARAPADVGRLQPARPPRARAPDEGPGARRAAAPRAPTCTGSPRRRCSSKPPDDDHARRAADRQGRQLRDVRGPRRERARAAARHHAPPRRRSTSRASIATTRRCARSRTSSCGSRASAATS